MQMFQMDLTAQLLSHVLPSAYRLLPLRMSIQIQFSTVKLAAVMRLQFFDSCLQMRARTMLV